MKNLNKFKRVYKKYTEWEEIQFNMWGEVKNIKKATNKALKLISDHKLYGKYMSKVIKEWTISCENALTDYSINRRAWLGQAAVALALKIPEHITRTAWKDLTHEQQFLANKEAEYYIKSWEYDYRKNITIFNNVEQQVLF